MNALRTRLADQTDAVPPGTMVLKFETDAGVEIGATVKSVISPAEADERGLFDVPTDLVVTSAIEAPVGKLTSLPVSRYWFGETFGDHSAITAVGHETVLTDALRAQGWSERDATENYIVFYELASAKGRSSALPGQDEPSGEIQVSSQPIRLPAAQGAIDAANGHNGDLEYEPWPRETVRLLDGEEVVVVPDAGEGIGPIRAGFLMITKETLVTVTGRFKVEEIPASAAQLRPLVP
jgi:hypothetical protein